MTGDKRTRSSSLKAFPADIEAIIDSALLVDLSSELFVPRHVHTAWQPLIDTVLDPAGVSLRSRPRLGSGGSMRQRLGTTIDSELVRVDIAIDFAAKTPATESPVEPTLAPLAIALLMNR